MEEIRVMIDRPAEFDHALHGDDKVPALKDGGDLMVITKNKAMQSGRAGAILTFTVEVDGKLRRAQTVVPVRLFKTVLSILNAAYDDDGMPR